MTVACLTTLMCNGSVLIITCICMACNTWQTLKDTTLGVFYMGPVAFHFAWSSWDPADAFALNPAKYTFGYRQFIYNMQANGFTGFGAAKEDLVGTDFEAMWGKYQMGGMLCLILLIVAIVFLALAMFVAFIAAADELSFITWGADFKVYLTEQCGGYLFPCGVPAGTVVVQTLAVLCYIGGTVMFWLQTSDCGEKLMYDHFGVAYKKDSRAMGAPLVWCMACCVIILVAYGNQIFAACTAKKEVLDVEVEHTVPQSYEYK